MASIDEALAAVLAPDASAGSVAAAPTAATAGVVIDGRTVYLGGAGTADDGTPCADAAATTVFVTASISKTFLAALALQCAERGELDLDADINVALAQSGETTPGRVGNPHFSSDIMVTPRQLLMHRSGLADDESNLEYGSPYRWPAGDAAAVSLAEYVQHELARDATAATVNWSSTAPPGSAPYHYSNAGFALLGLAVERAAGTPLPELARRRLFRPLGMDSTAYFMSELCDEREKGSDTRPPVRFAAPRGQPEPRGHYEVAEYPAAQVRSTAADLCRWLSFCSRPDVEPATEPKHVLGFESIKAMFPSTGRGALAWWGMDAQYSEKRQGQFEHGGFMQGVRTHIYLWPRSPEAKHASGCVVLLNGEASYDGVVSSIKQWLQVSKM